MTLNKWLRRKRNNLRRDPNPRERMNLRWDKAKVPIRITTISVQKGLYYNGVNIWFTIGDHPKEYFAETTNSESNHFDYTGYKDGSIIKLRDIEKIAITSAVRRIVINNILHEYKKDMVDIIFMVNEVGDTDKKAHFDYTITEDI